jgi:CHASE3 domain sensor protein
LVVVLHRHFSTSRPILKKIAAMAETPVSAQKSSSLNAILQSINHPGSPVSDEINEDLVLAELSVKKGGQFQAAQQKCRRKLGQSRQIIRGQQ